MATGRNEFLCYVGNIFFISCSNEQKATHNLSAYKYTIIWWKLLNNRLCTLSSSQHRWCMLKLKHRELSRHGSFGEKHFVFSYVFIQDLCRCKFIHQPTLVSFLQCACERLAKLSDDTEKKEAKRLLRKAASDWQIHCKIHNSSHSTASWLLRFFPFFSLSFFFCCCCLPLHTHISSHSHAASLMGRRQRHTDDDEEEDTRRIQFSFHHIFFVLFSYY